MVSETRLPALGSVLREKYRLDAVLGEGGFGRVYRGTELGTGRTVAVKVLKGSQFKLALRFRREARAIAGLRCENTLTLFDYGEDGDNLFMVTEFIDGEDLSERLHRDGPLDEAELVHVLRQALQSLREAHGHGVLHRDIKPANIRLYEYAGDPLRVKVLDFGLAKAIDGHEVALTKTGAVVGTPRYMSPEQMMGDDLTPATDIFSLGVVVLEALVGPGHALLSNLANRASGLRLQDERDVSPGLRDVVNRMLAPKIDARYRDAEEVLRDLHALSAGRVTAEAPGRPPDVERPAPSRPAPPPRRDPKPLEHPVERSSRMLVILGAMGALTLLAVAVTVLRSQIEPAPVPV